MEYHDDNAPEPCYPVVVRGERRRRRALDRQMWLRSLMRKGVFVAIVLFLSIGAHFFLFRAVTTKPETATSRKEIAPAASTPDLALLAEANVEEQNIPVSRPAVAPRLEPVVLKPLPTQTQKPTKEAKHDEPEKERPELFPKPQVKQPVKPVAIAKTSTGVETGHRQVSREELEPKGSPLEDLDAIRVAGQQAMEAINQAGSGMPALDIAYPNPLGYIRELYSLGAKTALEGDFSESPLMLVNLMEPDLATRPFRQEDVAFFSKARRRIDDEVLLQRLPITRKIGVHNLLLLVPVNIEALWLGSLVESARLKQIPITAIARAKCDYIANASGLLKCRQFVLKDGSVVDLEGARS